MPLMVALVGGQPLPNLLPARYYQPDHILFVYTQTTNQVFNRLKATLQHDINIHELETDAYNIVSIEEAIDNKLKEPELSSIPAIFNLTGGTKAMALAAYQVAQQHSKPLLYLESEGKQSRIYHYKWEHQNLKVSLNELLPECVVLRDLFDVHLGPQEWQEKGPSRNEGSPFEIALAESLRLHGYEVMIGVKAMNGQIDIDVAIRYKNQFGIIEAKMGESGKKLDGIKQLSNAVRHLGTYTQTFYAINVEQEPAHDAIMAASRIQVISLTNYIRGSNTLPSDVIQKLISIVDKALK